MAVLPIQPMNAVECTLIQTSESPSKTYSDPPCERQSPSKSFRSGCSASTPVTIWHTLSPILLPRVHDTGIAALNCCLPLSISAPVQGHENNPDYFVASDPHAIYACTVHTPTEQPGQPVHRHIHTRMEFQKVNPACKQRDIDESQGKK